METHSDLGGDILARSERLLANRVENFMFKFSRQICIALLLTVVLGHTSVAVHAAVHDNDDSIECQLCSSFGNAAPALAVAGSGADLQHFADTGQDPHTVDPASCSVSPYRQRGPPSRN